MATSLTDIGQINLDAQELKALVQTIPVLIQKIQDAGDKVVAWETTYAADSDKATDLANKKAWLKQQLLDLYNRY